MFLKNSHHSCEYLNHESLLQSIPGHFELPYILLFLFRNYASSSINLLARVTWILYHIQNISHTKSEYFNLFGRYMLAIGSLLHIRIKMYFL